MKRKRKKSLFDIKKALGAMVAGAGRLVVFLFPVAVGLLLTGAAFLGFRQALYNDRSFAVKHISVEPERALTGSHEQQFLSQWLGKNMLKADLKKVARELEKDPRIRRAEVSRRFPSELLIELQMRVPLGLIAAGPKHKAVLLSEDAVVLEIFEKPLPDYLVLRLENEEVHRLRRGQSLEIRGWGETVQFVKTFWNQPLAKKEKLNAVSLDRKGNLTITLGDGPDIRLGKRPMALLGDLGRILPILEGADRKDIQYIDLQFDPWVVKKKK